MTSQPAAMQPSRLARQGPIFLVGLGHGATHWVAATFYILLPYINRDLGLGYAQAGLLASIFHAASAGVFCSWQTPLVFRMGAAGGRRVAAC